MGKGRDTLQIFAHYQSQPETHDTLKLGIMHSNLV